MSPSEGERLCQEAQVHYYDLLSQEEAAVPAVVRRHVAACPACREEMRRLREALLEAQHPPDSARARQDETIEALAQQFQLLDAHVSCSEAKPLLPELALASARIRIPTPVTVHVDHCPQCARDLMAIRDLHLSADQLKRLGRLLEAARDGRLPCLGDSLVPAAPGPLLYEEADIVCNDIPLADLFDCVVPDDAAPSGATTMGERRRAVARHVQGCPGCLGQARALQRTVDEILARANSEIVTVYHAGEDAQEASGETGGEYPYPVSVQVLHDRSEAAVLTPGGRAAPAAGLRQLGRFAKPLAAAAALVLVMITLGSFLRMTASTASGTNVGDIDRALARVKNVHFVVQDRDGELVQEFWIARRASVLVQRRVEDCILYDLARGRKRTIDLQTGSRASARLSQIERDGSRQLMASCLRDLVAEVSSGAELRPPAGEIGSGAGEGISVYELRPPPRARNAPLRVRRLVYLDSATGLPQRMEYYHQMPRAGGWSVAITTTFTYPTEEKMNDAIQALFPAE